MWWLKSSNCAALWLPGLKPMPSILRNTIRVARMGFQIKEEKKSCLDAVVHNYEDTRLTDYKKISTMLQAETLMLRFVFHCLVCI